MEWKLNKNNPPDHEGVYEVLVLYNNELCLLHGRYNKGGYWELDVDGFGWTADTGYEPVYWLELPPFPSLKENNVL